MIPAFRQPTGTKESVRIRTVAVHGRVSCQGPFTYVESLLELTQAPPADGDAGEEAIEILPRNRLQPHGLVECLQRLGLPVLEAERCAQVDPDAGVPCVRR